MKIIEIFRSLQGEGRNQGRPCTFIRLAGCNLHCRWCDTEYARSNGTERNLKSVLDEVRHIDGAYICITGGEPLLQGGPVLELLQVLAGEGYSTEIETNGTIDFRPFQPYASICMDVKCPSSGEKSDLGLLSAITTTDTVKFVVLDRTDCEYAREIICSHPIQGEIFLSPVFGSDYRDIADFIIEYNLPVRFQLQLHRIIGVR